MLVRMPQTLSVTEHFQLGRFGQVRRLLRRPAAQPTNVVAPGARGHALQAAERPQPADHRRRHRTAQNPDPILFGRGGQPLSAAQHAARRRHRHRRGRRHDLHLGRQRGQRQRLPRCARSNALGGAASTSRPPTRGRLGAATSAVRVRVAGDEPAELLQHLRRLPDRSTTAPAVSPARPPTAAAPTPRPSSTGSGPRPSRPSAAIDADVIGINEIENDGYGPTARSQTSSTSSTRRPAPGTYAFIDADAATGQVDALGTDAIKVGPIYKPAEVTPVGDTAVLNTVAFVNGGDSARAAGRRWPRRSRRTRPVGVFIADVNHLKSKGWPATRPDAGDGQGNCNAARTVAADALAPGWPPTRPAPATRTCCSWATTTPTPRRTRSRPSRAAGFTNLIEDRIGADAYCYVFDGQWGYLDHALGSRRSARR